MESIQQQDEKRKALNFSDQLINEFQTSSRWGGFIALFSAFLVFFSLFFYSFFMIQTWNKSGLSFRDIMAEAGSQGYVILGLMIGMLVIYLLGCIALWGFSKNMQLAIQLKSSRTLEVAIGDLHRFFKYNGIFAIVSILWATFSWLEIYPFNF